MIYPLGFAGCDRAVTQFLRSTRRSRAARVVALASLAAIIAPALGQTSTSPLAPPPNGVREADLNHAALINATVHVSPTETLEHATVVIRNGLIVSVTPGQGADDDGKADNQTTPAGARVWDCTGLHLYAGFIDPFVEVEVPVAPAGSPGLHWNPLITPQRDALQGPGVTREIADSLRKLGFTAANLVPTRGIIRGTTAVVSLGVVSDDPSDIRPPVYAGSDADTEFLAIGFDTVGFGGGGGAPGAPAAPTVTYPQSRIGSVALLRQSFMDAAWQRDARDAGQTIPTNCLDSLSDSSQRLLFDSDSELESLRAAPLSEEFGRQGILVASGFEVRALQPVVDMAWPVILPLNFPETPDVSSVGRIDGLSLTDLMTWEQAPTTPRRLDAAGVAVSFTTAKVRRREQFDDNLRTAIKNGLSEGRALAMLTTNPAELLGVSDLMGTIEAGKIANLVVASDNIFKADTTIRDIWIDGVRTELNAAPDPKLDGDWDITFVLPPAVAPIAEPITGVLAFESGRKVRFIDGDRSINGRNARLAGNQVSFLLDSISPDLDPGESIVSAALDSETRMVGHVAMPSGSISQFLATRQGPDADPSGVWSLTLGEGGRTITYMIRNNKVVYEGDAARTNTVRDFKVDGNVLTFTVETRPLPAPTSAAPGAAPETPDSGADAPPAVAQPDTPEGGEPADQPAATPTGQGTPASPQTEQPTTQPGTQPASEPAAPEVQPAAPAAPTTTTSIRATIEGDSITGTVTTQDGLEIPFTGTRSPLPPEDPKPETPPAVPEELGAPFGPYARSGLPSQEILIFRNATIWTSGEAGIIQNGSMLTAGGQITYVGDDAGLSDLLSRIRLTGPPREIDAQGKHITAGLIDCHSHTGLTDINEGGQSCSAEVRVSDAMDHTDISWYRQLAGGITTVNQLHGSANAIGGQNQIAKPRWGAPLPSDFFFEGAPEGIKFALGENPKQGNSYGANATRRYPQTRMGVEAVIRDRFNAAREYAGAMERFAGGDGPPPRRDLELEALAEILSGQRLVHCHSYRADEILMLCNIAREFGFRIGTFQHALEVYKVAAEVRESAIGASAFSDWWAYKVEVQDAIPYAGSIMHDVGIVVSFNSDSDELARRMNIEAAKAVRYGNVDPAEALKFVTLNPAIQLGIADRVGSLESGKDADFVVWSGDPLSTFSRPEATYIEGRCYFSLEDDAAMRARNESERRRIIQRILADSKPAAGGSDSEGSGGRPSGPGGPPGRGPRPGVLGLASAAAENALSNHILDLIRQGQDPTSAICGDCGMTLQDLMNR